MFGFLWEMIAAGVMMLLLGCYPRIGCVCVCVGGWQLCGNELDYVRRRFFILTARS